MIDDVRASIPVACIWHMQYGAQYAQAIDEDGTETIVGYKTTITNDDGEEFDQFVYVNEKGELIKPKI